MARPLPVKNFKYIVNLPCGNGSEYFETLRDVADFYNLNYNWVRMCVQRDRPLDEFGMTIDEVLDCNTRP